MRRLLALLLCLLAGPAFAEIINPGMFPTGSITANDLVVYKDASGFPTKDPGIGTLSGRIVNLSDPINPLDAANKEYVDHIAAGLTPVSGGPAIVATTANLTATYANGSSGVGATLTNSGTLAALVIDGVTITNGQRILVKDQTTQLQNGIYTQTTLGTGAVAWVLTRATDFDQATSGEVAFGATVAISQGTLQAGTVWFESCPGPFTIGTTAICFSRFGAGGAALPTNDIFVGNAGNIATAVPMSGDCTIVASGAITCTGATHLALTDTHIFVGSGSNLASDVAMSGDCTMADTGAITCTKINGQVVTFPLALSLGGTHANLSATGGTGQVLQQSSVGANITVGTLSLSNLTGSVSCAQLPSLGGDISTPAGSCTTTISTVNSNVGTFQGITVNAKGQVTAATNWIGGTNGQIQYNNSGALGGTALTYNGTTITNAPDPVSALDVVNKEYVDNLAAGLTPVSGGPAIVATTANLTATYANGSSGVGATLTNSGTLAALVIDGVTIANGQRILVKDQTSQAQNGVYTQTTLGTGAVAWVLTRSTDFDQATTGEVEFGATIAIAQGTTQAGQVYFESCPGPFTIGTTAICFSRFGAGPAPLTNAHLFVGNATNVATDVAASGDVTLANTGAFTVAKVDGVTYPSGPSLNTVPVVTNAAGGGTVTYEAVPNAALVNSSTTVNGQTCTLGSTCTISASPGALTSAHIFVGNGSNVATDVAVSGVVTLANTGAFSFASIAANTFLANTTSGSAAPTATSLSGCSGNNHASQYTSNTGFTCATDITNLDVADQTVTGGANVTSQSQTAGNITVDCGSRPAQYIANTGAFTITAPSNDGYCYLDVENGAGAGTVSLSGFSPNTMGGATLDTTNGHNFRLIISRVHAHSNIFAVALQ